MHRKSFGFSDSKESENPKLIILGSTDLSSADSALLLLVDGDAIYCLSASYKQGLTKAWLKRDQMALGVFPNSHECQQIEFPV